MPLRMHPVFVEQVFQSTWVFEPRFRTVSGWGVNVIVDMAVGRCELGASVANNVGLSGTSIFS